MSNGRMMVAGSGESMTMAQAALVFDLAAGGVHAEMGEEFYPWFAGDAVPKAPVGKPVAAERTAERVADIGVQPKAQAKVPLLAMTRVAKIWHAGEAGGLVVAVHAAPGLAGQVPLAGAELELLHKMLVAVGLPAEVRGWAVIGQPDERVRDDLRDEMGAAVCTLQPERLLVLGGVALGTLLGRPCGVEGWREEDVPALWRGPGVARVGVTYPPSLLLEKPVFKRLAWQHLLVWQARCEIQNQEQGVA